MRTAARNIFTTIRTEGALLPADFLQHVAEGNREIEGLSPDSYHLVPGEKLNEAINRSWNRLLGAWTGFKDASEKLGASDLGTGLTRERWLLPLFQELGYGRLQTAKAFEIDGKSYPISHGWQGTPIHLVGCKIDLDRRTSGVVGAARTSPHGLVQEMLNRSEAHLWGFVSNGHRLRILRDNITLTRQAFVDFDLVAMFDGEVYADFVVLWLLCHQSRVEGERPEPCWLEKWSQLAEKRGTRVLEYLRTGVENAINALGSGFLAHPANRELRTKLSSATFNSQDYYRQLLRVVYRILFLFVAEDRGLLFEPKSSVAARALYSRFYSVARLRRLAERRAGTQHPDLWRGLTLVFEKLDIGCAELALPALGSFLWSREATTELTGCELANRDLLKAIHSLAFTVDVRVRRVVDYKNLGSEELGSIYEALLELHPRLNVNAATFTLSTAAGNERKITGSYYTPASLVNCLLDSALDPVLSEACKRPNPGQAILDLKVCDPASGSGHFLIAAAHRLAKRLGALRTGDEEPSPEATRTALRDVIGRCIYGVDLNPMAVELCKVSLWLEALEPGKPLSFLDHRIKVGNSLLGATPALIGKGIPDEAFTALEGDDKTFAAALKRANKAAREQSNMLLFSGEIIWQALAKVKDGVVHLEAIEDDTLDNIHAKQAEFEALVTGGDYRDQKLVADAWCAAFTVLKTKETAFRLTEEEFSMILANPRAFAEPMRARIKAEAEAHSFFHWHLEFPDIFGPPRGGQKAENDGTGWDGGFDVILGNPPWDKIQPEEQKFFASSRPEIANAGNAKLRKALIEALPETDPNLNHLWIEYKRQIDATCHLLADGSILRFAEGNLNTYRVFTEICSQLLATTGRAGLVVQTGLATDESGKELFNYLLSDGRLVRFLDFENRHIFFPAVHPQFRFSLLTLAGTARRKITREAEFGWLLHGVERLSDPGRLVRLSASDLVLFNPSSRTCPMFTSQQDFMISKEIYEHGQHIFLDESHRLGEIDFLGELFNMTRDVRHFSEDAGENSLRLYEAKFIHQFDHRFASWSRGGVYDLTTAEKANPRMFVVPKSFVNLAIVRERTSRRGIRTNWMSGFRSIASSTNERTSIMAVFPFSAVGNSINLILGLSADKTALLMANANSFIFDFCARQKISGSNVNIWIFKQLPAIPFIAYTQLCSWVSDGRTLKEWLLKRVLELTFTAWDLEPFARDCGWLGPVFNWDEARRFHLRCELDAAFFHLYGTHREHIARIMDTFPIVKKRDEEEHGGKYRTRDTILEIYDEMAEAARTGVSYQNPNKPVAG